MIGFAPPSLVNDVLAAHRAGTGTGYFKGSISIDVARNGIAFMNYNSSTTVAQLQAFLAIEEINVSGTALIRGDDSAQV
jgi:hypothetical protein